MSDYLKRLNSLKEATQKAVDREEGQKKKKILNRKIETIDKMIEDIGAGEKPFFLTGFLSTSRGKVQLG